jgi:predicted Zn-dependent protease
LDYVNRWSDDPDRSLVEAGRLADRMIQLVPEHAGGHYQAAITALFARDFDRFCHEGEMAMALSPGSESASNMRGQLCLASEAPLNAVPHFERAMRLDPGTTLIQLQLLGMAYLFGGRYETAAAVFRERILMMPDTDWSRAYLASALGHLGKLEEARQVWTELMAINPSYSMAERLHRNGVQPRHMDIVLEGARKAGLPV